MAHIMISVTFIFFKLMDVRNSRIRVTDYCVTLHSRGMFDSVNL
jgi:hypothetical protein